MSNQELTRPRQQVGSSLPLALAACPQFKILDPVIRFDAVDVMDVLRFVKRAAEKLFHDESVLENLHLLAVDREARSDVAVSFRVPSPLGLSHRLGSAFARAMLRVAPSNCAWDCSEGRPADRTCEITHRSRCLSSPLALARTVLASVRTTGFVLKFLSAVRAMKRNLILWSASRHFGTPSSREGSIMPKFGRLINRNVNGIGTAGNSLIYRGVS